MPTGTVKWFDEKKGFGFLSNDEGGSDVFVHISAVENSGLNTLREGDKFTFDIEKDTKRNKENAANLQKVA